MKIRDASYTASEAVRKVIDEEIIELLVKTTVDKAYDQNMELEGKVFANRYVLPLVEGRAVTLDEALVALNSRKTISKLLVLVCLTENKGEDEAEVFLQSEIEDMIAQHKQVPDEVKEFIAIRPRKFPWE
jgi:hypothetical protein